MLFNSIDFAIFLPIVFLFYWFLFNRIGNKASNLFLIASSYVFYGWWNWRVVLLLLAVTLVSYSAGYLMNYFRYRNLEEENKVWYKNKVFLFNLLAIVINIGLLGFFKYYNFFVSSFVSLFRLFDTEFSFSTIKILLPVGISFYVFQSLTYTIDIYYKKIKPTTDVISFFGFMSFFPPLLSGPIGRASAMIPQFQLNRTFDYDLAVKGSQQLLWGLFMKICIADRLGMYVDAVYGNIEFHNGTSVLFASILYSFQIYCDFSGYSLMAIGIAKLFGFRLMDNFRRPYLAASVKDFWSRWHISLSTWFRDYVYIPLGGSRVSSQRHYFNLFVTFLISGLWHGAAWTFVLWGALHGLFQVIETIINKHRKTVNKKSEIKLIKIVFVFVFVTFAWIFFRITDFSNAWLAVNKIFTNPGSLFIDFAALSQGLVMLSLLVLYELLSEFAPVFTNRIKNNKILNYLGTVGLIVIIILFAIFDGGQFIYFQF